jgi:hypothetical protein
MRYEVKRKALPAAATVKKMPLRPLRCGVSISLGEASIGGGSSLDVPEERHDAGRMRDVWWVRWIAVAIGAEYEGHSYFNEMPVAIV